MWEGRDVYIQFESFFQDLFPLLEKNNYKFVKMTDSDSVKFSQNCLKLFMKWVLDKTDLILKLKTIFKNGGSKSF